MLEFNDVIYQEIMESFEIYIPMEDSCGHWFMMVIHLEKSKIFHLDSFLVDDKTEGRRQQIRKIAIVLSSLLLLIYKADTSFCLLPDFEKWEIVEPRGIPNVGNSENSGLWVAEWLNMEQSFNEQMTGVLDDRTVRMKIALRLLTGPHNGLRRVLEMKAADYWNMHTDNTP
ncbi:uncharacterized protein LOC123894574 [Trifolium pratense]|uniref:uncharacterized protein LOC123894574 n=1 Tax=Trifolium pratense TaxID=57577 RepID=UPI001E690110|nr:uncharacterized protein LOC123894574 [Trifolium pratense]XP_045800561.1 uncharacterized protein LOC123894574 [Trifolium pratense]